MQDLGRSNTAVCRRVKARAVNGLGEYRLGTDFMASSDRHIMFYGSTRPRIDFLSNSTLNPCPVCASLGPPATLHTVSGLQTSPGRAGEWTESLVPPGADTSATHPTQSPRPSFHHGTGMRMATSRIGTSAEPLASADPFERKGAATLHRAAGRGTRERQRKRRGTRSSRHAARHRQLQRLARHAARPAEGRHHNEETRRLPVSQERKWDPPMSDTVGH